MAYFLFLDESGQDHHDSPYEVLGGIAIEDVNLWNFIQDAQRLEYDCFGMRYSSGSRELKGKKILKRKSYRQAIGHEAFLPEQRQQLAHQALSDGAGANPLSLAALGQAKIDFVGQLLDLCFKYRCKVFASIVDPGRPLSVDENLLRKDYVYLLERFFYFIEDHRFPHQGIVVFDELEKSRSHILIGQMDRYFKKTEKGRERSSVIIPEPFFVHSDLTTGIQVADIACYIISWGMRFGTMNAPAREELAGFVEKIRRLRYRTTRDFGEDQPTEIWSVKFLG